MSKTKIGLVGLFAAAALLVGSNVSAATASDLQSQIDALLAQIAALQGGSSSSSSCYSFTRDLTVGAQGADVTALQNYLAGKGYFNVAATGYFGSITASAVSAWQSANGVSPAAGYFGAISRAKYNSMCAPMMGDDDDSSDDDDDDFNAGDGEEASLEDFDAKSGDDTDLEEGDKDAEVMEFEFDVEDADVEVQRVEIVASSSAGNGEEDPWDVFESATLMLDGEEVGSVDGLDDEDNWSDGNSDGEYYFRFNGIDSVVKDGDTAEFVLALTLQDNLDDIDDGEGWVLWIEDEGIRALDEAGIDQYTGQDTDTVTIDIDAAGGDDELSLGESDNNPDAATLEVDDSDKSAWHSLAVMELDADTDTELKDFVFRVLINEAGADTEDYEDVVDDLELVIDGETYDDFSVTGPTTATATVTFDLDGEDLIIDGGDTVEVEVRAKFLATTTGAYDEGTTVTVDVPAATFDTVDAEGVDSGEDLSTDALKGSFEGEVMTLRSEGLIVTFVSADQDAPVGSDEAQASFKVVFTAEAFGEDFFIEKTTARDASGDVDDGVNYVIEDGSGTEYSTTTATVSGSLSKSGNTTGDTATHYKVAEGQTRTFTLSVTLDNDGASTEGEGYYRLAITGIAFDLDGSGAAADGGVVTTGLDLFETETVFVDDADANN